jgi:hypothetical protein
MIIGVIGKPRMGKTLFITMLGYFDAFADEIINGNKSTSFDRIFLRLLGYNEYLIKRKIFANYALSFDYTPYDLDDVLSIKHMKMDIEPKTFLMQEAGKWFDSRNSMSPENRDLINFTGQSGKRETNLYYDDQFITRIDRGLRDVTEKSYIANCIRKPDNTPILFEYEEYGGYFQYPTNRTIKLPAFWIKQFYGKYDTRQATIRA